MIESFFCTQRNDWQLFFWISTCSLEKFVACVFRVQYKDTLYLFVFGRDDAEVLHWKYSIMSDFLGGIFSPVISLILGNILLNARRRKRDVSG